jgi:hypothetical protein
VLRQSFPVSLLSCFEMRTGEAIPVLRRPDRRSATTVDIALMQGVDLCPPIMNRCGGGPAPSCTNAGLHQFGTDRVSCPNCDDSIIISYNS